MTKYQNRGGEIWETTPDGHGRELFAGEAIARLETLEKSLVEMGRKLNEIQAEAEERDKNNGDISPAWILQVLE